MAIRRSYSEGDFVPRYVSHLLSCMLAGDLPRRVTLRRLDTPAALLPTHLLPPIPESFTAGDGAFSDAVGRHLYKLASPPPSVVADGSAGRCQFDFRVHGSMIPDGAQACRAEVRFHAPAVASDCFLTLELM